MGPRSSSGARWRPALRTRVALTVVVTVLALGVLATAAIEAVMRDSIERAEESSALVIGRNLAGASVDPVLRDDVVELTRLIREVAEPDPSITYIYVVDEDGGVMASTLGPRVPAGLLEVNRLRAGEEHRLQHVETERGPVLDVGVQVLDGSAGAIHVGLSDAEHVRAIERVRLLLLAITAAMGVIGFVASLVAGRLVTRPLATLAEAAQRIRDGDLASRVDVVADREVGALADSFNGMAEALQADITQREANEAALRESRERYEALFGSINDGILVVDMQGRLIETNDVLLARLGYRREELLGTSVAAIDSPEMARRVPERMAMLAAEGKAVFESEHVAKDGTLIPVEISSRTFTYGGTPAVVSIARNITDRKRAERELMELNADLERKVRERTRELEDLNEELACMNEELRSSNEMLEETNQHLDEATRAKSEFLASMSHELRTPLNSIIGFSGVLEQGLAGELNEEQATQVGMIHSAGRHLLDLVNEILDISKIEAGRLRLDVKEFDAKEVATHAFETVRPLAETAGLEARLVLSDDLDGVVSDPVRVRQILFNLLSNAVKFTERGHVELAVRKHEDQVVFEVSDTGVGIAAEHHRHIFEEFYQVRDANGLKTAGTGLGLAVSLRLAEALGGRLDVSSGPGKGSVFTFTLPVRGGATG